ncbi:hypothetical protein [Arenibacter certesii]|uniref:hypothetical protein n=1 Tax=Arenibacter certesii TaxID=228955 RepID=UPI00047E3363|nr:hypothetical protein [Arenibacter certesii]
MRLIFLANACVIIIKCYILKVLSATQIEDLGTEGKIKFATLFMVASYHYSDKGIDDLGAFTRRIEAKKPHKKTRPRFILPSTVPPLRVHNYSMKPIPRKN